MTNMDYSGDISKCVILSDFPSIPFDSNLALLILSHHTTFFGAENTLHNKNIFLFPNETSTETNITKKHSSTATSMATHRGEGQIYSI
jgi:hypothetical protein